METKEISNTIITIKKSKIHNNGAFAKQNILKGIRIIEYRGERVTKEEGTYREKISVMKSKRNERNAATYIFELNKEYDIDGDVPYNMAKFINHSCSPNCEVEVKNGHIWFISKKNIKKYEELTCNYGFSLNDCKSHPCKCGSENCVGLILAEDYWPKLKNM